MTKTVRTSKQFLGKTSHLYAISKAPECTWPLLCHYLLQGEWTVKDTRENVTNVTAFTIPGASLRAPQPPADRALRPAQPDQVGG